MLRYEKLRYFKDGSICFLYFQIFLVIKKGCKGPDLVNILEVPKMIQKSIGICPGTLISHFGII